MRAAFTADLMMLGTSLPKAPTDLPYVHPVVIFFGIELIYFWVQEIVGDYVLGVYFPADHHEAALTEVYGAIIKNRGQTGLRNLVDIPS